MFEKIKEKYVLVFSLVLLVWGIIFSQLMVPWQTPDERNHLWFIGKDVGNEKIYDEFLADLPLDQYRIAFNSNEKLSFDQIIDAMHKKPNYSVQKVMPHTIHLAIIKHLPAAVGVYLGVLLRLPTYWALALGELFSLLYYVWISALIIKNVPRNKALFAAFLMLPMNIQQCTSISYDAVLLPLCYLLVALIYKFKCENRDLTNKEIIVLILLWLLVTYIKVPYGALGLLFFIVPINRYVITVRGKEYKLKNNILTYAIVIILIAVLAVAGAYVLRNDANVAVLLACFKHPLQTVRLMKVTLSNWWKFFLVSLIGDFGYLDAPLANWMVVVSLIAMMVISIVGEKKEKTKSQIVKANISDRILYIVTAFIIFVIVTLALIRHTYMMIYYGSETAPATIDYNQILYQIPYIGGEQGRYYLPGYLPFLLTFTDIVQCKPVIGKVISGLLIVFYIVISAFTLKVRYFG